MNGNWGAWSKHDWGECSGGPRTKGKKKRIFTRKCNNPAPSDGGKKCVAKSGENGESKDQTADCGKYNLIL